MILQTENIYKKYKQRMVVKDVSVQVEQGEIVGLLGPNGAGKTTTFYMIVGLIKPYDGKVLLDKLAARLIYGPEPASAPVEPEYLLREEGLSPRKALLMARKEISRMGAVATEMVWNIIETFKRKDIPFVEAVFDQDERVVVDERGEMLDHLFGRELRPGELIASGVVELGGGHVDGDRDVFAGPISGRFDRFDDDVEDGPIIGEIDTALLREPEASFALYETGKDGQVSIAYKDLWEQIYPGKGNLPNAGVLFKGEILRDYPELAEIFLQETEKAVEWVKANPKESAKISYDIMGVTPEEAELFFY
jgi:energy-coupling factor transporter ATP-binding protein EcfA2